MDFQSGKMSESSVLYLLEVVNPLSTPLRDQAELNQAFASGLLLSPSVQRPGKSGYKIRERKLTNIILLERERMKRSMSLVLCVLLSQVETRGYTWLIKQSGTGEENSTLKAPLSPL